MIYVIAAIQIKANTLDAFIKEFKKIVPSVRAEEGCIQYDPCLNVPCDMVSASDNKEVITVTCVEGWESVDHLKRHLATEHMNSFHAATEDMRIGCDLRIVEPA
ncbi:MAG: antibiotic biosynthesis monooxygenase [Lentisphaeria bacterium]|nr:antibiotic biosynthesis monooxygenase [Lentisphaeria bacterium]